MQVMEVNAVDRHKPDAVRIVAFYSKTDMVINVLGSCQPRVSRNKKQQCGNKAASKTTVSASGIKEQKETVWKQGSFEDTVSASGTKEQKATVWKQGSLEDTVSASGIKEQKGTVWKQGSLEDTVIHHEG